VKKDEGRRLEGKNYGTGNSFLLPSSFVLFVLLCSCAIVTNVPQPRQGYIIENVPFYTQTTYQCGPSSLAGVMNYWGITVTPDEITEEIYSESARGTLSIDMVLYPQRRGLKTDHYRGDMKDLKRNIELGHPVIVLVDYGFSVYQVNHFMVVVGYNESGVIVNSGKERGKFIAEKYFMRSWERTEFWTLLIKPR